MRARAKCVGGWRAHLCAFFLLPCCLSLALSVDYKNGCKDVMLAYIFTIAFNKFIFCFRFHLWIDSFTVPRRLVIATSVSYLSTVFHIWLGCDGANYGNSLGDRTRRAIIAQMHKSTAREANQKQSRRIRNWVERKGMDAWHLHVCVCVRVCCERPRRLHPKMRRA